MRNPERIKRILKELETIWQSSPDLRFGQMLIHLRLIKDDLLVWQREDDEFEEILAKIRKEREKHKAKGL